MTKRATRPVASPAAPVRPASNSDAGAPSPLWVAEDGNNWTFTGKKLKLRVWRDAFYFGYIVTRIDVPHTFDNAAKYLKTVFEHGGNGGWRYELDDAKVAAETVAAELVQKGIK